MGEQATSEQMTDAARLALAAEQLVRLVDAASTSGVEACAVDEAERIAGELGLPSQRMPVAPGRDNLLVGAPAAVVLLCTHLDTVPPHIPARRDPTHIHGRGSADAKGCAVAMLHGLALAWEAGLGEFVGCLLVVGEESDHAGAQAAVEAGITPEHVVLGEPCGLSPAVAQKGMLKLQLLARGEAGHSAYPELGASAVHRLVDALARLRQVTLPADPELGETTVNVGLISGGVAANVIAAEAQALVLVRCAAPVDKVLAEIVGALGAEIEATEISRAEPLRFDLAGQAPGSAVPFNTDAHWLARTGARLTLMGPGDMRCAHAADERLALSDLALGIAAYAEVLSTLAGPHLRP